MGDLGQHKSIKTELAHLTSGGGQVVPLKYDVRNEDSIRAAIAKANVVVNVIGCDWETRNFSFHDINVNAPARIARLAKEHGGIERFIHVSCLGASPSATSIQLRTKAAGDEAVLKAFPDATVVRPGPLVGTEDRLLNSWAQQAKKLPGVPVYKGGTTRMQPVHVSDAAAGIMAALRDEGGTDGRILELGGPDVYSVLDLIHLMFETIREHPRIINIPMPVAKLLTLPRELLLRRVPFPIPAPTMFTRDYIDSLEQDYIVDPSALGFEELNIKPMALKGVAIDHLLSYRSGGPAHGSTLGEEAGRSGGTGRRELASVKLEEIIANHVYGSNSLTTIAKLVFPVTNIGNCCSPSSVLFFTAASCNAIFPKPLNSSSMFSELFPGISNE
eukprot:SM000084S23095  [mRNA]  locus=s84:41685:44476:- [translate_table: standard]